MTTLDPTAADATPTPAPPRGAVTGAFLIGRVAVKDAAKWATYCSLVPGTLAAWRATIVARGTNPVVLNGGADGADVVVVEFPDLASAEGWYASPSYQALVPLRDEAADVTIVAYES